MKPSLLPSFAALTAGLLLLIGASSAYAGGRSGVDWSISIGTPSPPVVYGPVYGRAYGPPPGVYVQPPPVYVQPHPAYVQPQPVFVNPPPVVIYDHPGYVTYGRPHYGEARDHHRFRHQDRHHHGRRHGGHGRD